MKELIFGNLELFIGAFFSAMVAGCAVFSFSLWVCFVKNGNVKKTPLMIFWSIPLLLAALALFFFAANIPYDDDYNTIVAYMARPWPERIYHLFDYNWEHRVVLTNLCAEMMALTTGRINFVWLEVVGLSFAFFISLLFACRLRKYGTTGVLASASLVWLLMAVISDYFFWPMASIQNNGVLFLAFMTLVVWKRKGLWWYALAVALAVTCTFTSGSGMIVWPVMAFMMWARGDCRKGFALELLFIFLSVASILLYFHEPWVSQDNLHESFSLFRAVFYFLTFMGGWTCLPGVSVVAGVLTIAVLVRCFTRIDELRWPEVFFLAVFITANMLSGALFRSDRIINALPPRHSELSFALLGCSVILLFDQITVPLLWKRIGVSALCGYAVFVNVFSFFFFGKIWCERLEIDRRNLLMRPYRVEALTSIHGPWHDNAVKNLRYLEEKGIYNSNWTLKDREVPPLEQIDPGDFWTPGRRCGDSGNGQ